MKKIINFLSKRLEWISPDFADHFRYMVLEAYVYMIHRGNFKRCLRGNKDAKNIKVNFGCGAAKKDGFINLDFSPVADYRLDLRKEIPLSDVSCDLAYSEHFIEHLSYPEGVEKFFSECYRVLAPGGEISISVPDTEWPLLEYARDGADYLKVCELHGWHPKDCTTYGEHVNFHFRQRWRGISYSNFENHRFAWDYVTLKKKLEEAGFTGVSRRQFDADLDSEHRRVGSLFAIARKA
jgi:predicted SAM-dependent methyltransferase